MTTNVLTLSTYKIYINGESADFVQNLINDAIENGAEVVIGNKREDNLIYPTLLDYVTGDMRVAWDEPFGPVLPIIRVSSDEQAIKMANASEQFFQQFRLDRFHLFRVFNCIVL